MFVGIDHSTTGVKTCVLDEDGSSDIFVIERSPGEDCDWSYLEKLNEYAPLDDIEMIAYGYCWGDGFSKIKNIKNTNNRGLIDKMGLGNDFGTGTLVFDQLEESSLPCVVFPGVHKGIESLHPYFRYHSPMTGADKIAMTRYAQEVVDDSESDEQSSFIAACISSSEMATFVDRGTLRAAFTWMGLIHGWPGIDEFRDVHAGDKELMNLFTQSGILHRSGRDFGSVKGIPDEEFLEQIYWATLHNIYSLLPFAQQDGVGIDKIVISDRLSRVTEPINVEARLTEALSDIGDIYVCQEYSTARGAAYIAQDVAEGASDVVGIPVADRVRRSATITETND